MGMIPEEMFQHMAEAAEKAKQEAEARINRDPEEIMDALGREPLTGLKFGDIVKQIRLGTEYRYEGQDRCEIFVRYLPHPLDRRYKNGEMVDDPDMVIASGVDRESGQIHMYAVDSRHYEKL